MLFPCNNNLLTHLNIDQQYQLELIIQKMLDAASNQQKILKLKELLRDNTSPIKQNTAHKETYSQSKTGIRKQMQRCLEIEEKMNIRLEQQWKIYQSILIEVENLQQEARGLKKQIERTKQMVEQKASLLQREMSQEVTEQTEQIKAIRRELMQSIEKKYRTIKTQTMAVLGSQFQSGWDQSRQEIIKHIEEIRNKMEREQAARDELVTFMVSNFGEEILKAEQMVQKQRNDRIQTHKKIATSISLIEQEITNSILLEKRESVNSIHGLQGFLEELCYKIESHVLH